jgi:hypothetical protein
MEQPTRNAFLDDGEKLCLIQETLSGQNAVRELGHHIRDISLPGKQQTPAAFHEQFPVTPIDLG